MVVSSVLVALCLSTPAQAEAPPDFVRITAGEFTMGSPSAHGRFEKGRDGDEAQHRVRLTVDYEIMAHEVTQEQFSQAMGYAPSAHTSCGPDCPVEHVSWHEALAFANARSVEAELPTCYTCQGEGDAVRCSLDPSLARPQDCGGYRLPTEAEWEYAARAGTETAFYSGPITDTECADPGLDGIGWYCGNAGDTPHPVARKLPNAWGLYDMSGNVAEWVWGWYEHEVWDWGHYYGPDPLVDPTGQATGELMVYRGGDYSYYSQYCRSASRHSGSPAEGAKEVGFRLARSLR